MAKQKRDPVATRESILEAADKIFNLKGYDGASLGDIARCAGINKSLIHHYFGSKEELHLASLRRSFPIYAIRLAQYMREAESAEDRILAGFKAFFRFLTETPEYTRFGLWMTLFLGNDKDKVDASLNAQCNIEFDPEVVYAQTSGQRFLAIIEEEQKNGRLRSDLPAIDMLSAIFCLAEHWNESRGLMSLVFGKNLCSDEIHTSFEDSALKILTQGILPQKISKRSRS